MTAASTPLVSAHDGSGAPTRIRYRVLAYLCGLSMITYLDRVCFGAAAPAIAGELWPATVADLKWSFTAFALAYAAFEIPSAWLGDTLGPRRTLIRIVLWWSAFTALTGVVGLRFGGWTLFGLGSLAGLRFLFGAGEAGAYPNITRALYNWFPVSERSTAQGLIWTAGRLMGGLTPLVWTLLVAGSAWTRPLVDWHGAFWLLGGVGILWCVGFARSFVDDPAHHPRVNQAERDVIRRDNPDFKTADNKSAASDMVAGHGAVPWRAFRASGSLWLLCLMYLCVNYGWYFNITYLPAYVHERFPHDEPSMLLAIYQGAPLWVGAAGCLAGGVLADRLARRWADRRRARRLLCSSSLALAAVCWCAAIVAPNVHAFCLAVSSAAFLNDLMMASAWTACQDMGRRFAGITAACMNTVGTCGSALSGWLTGTLVHASLAAQADQLQEGIGELPRSVAQAAELAGYDQSFATYAAAYVVAALCWQLIDSTRPIAPANAEPEITSPPGGEV